MASFTPPRDPGRLTTTARPDTPASPRESIALTLPVAGAYAIIIDPSVANTGGMSVQLYDVQDDAGPITPGGTPVRSTVTRTLPSPSCASITVPAADDPLVGLSVADADGPVTVDAHDASTSAAMESRINFFMKNLRLSK